MRFFILISSFCFLSIAGIAQGLLNNGANIVLQNGSNVVISGNGNWTNNGTVNCNSGSTVLFVGSSLQSIDGTNTTAFSNLTVNNTGGGIIINRDISVLSTLQMNSGDIDLKSSIVDLSTTGLLSNESAARRIKATDALGSDGLGSGTIRAVRNNPSGNVAGLGLNFTPSANLGSTIVIRGHERQQGSGSFTSNYSIFRYYEIQPTTIQPLSTIVFNYFDSELNGHTESELLMYERAQYVSGVPGPVYWEPQAGTVNVASNIVNSSAPLNALTYFRLTLGSISTPLPVELVYFDSECDNQGVLLKWQTASELNSDYFELQRSFSGTDFISIARVPASGNSNTIIDYSYNDSEVSSFPVFYRINQIDRDGSEKLSDIIPASCGTTESPVFNAYSFDHSIVVDFSGGADSYNLLVTDVLGRILYSEKIVLSSFSREQISLSDLQLAQGIYNIILLSSSDSQSKKVFCP